MLFIEIMTISVLLILKTYICGIIVTNVAVASNRHVGCFYLLWPADGASSFENFFFNAKFI